MAPTQETDRLAHELDVHQAELLLQNEELRNTQLELEIARNEYFALYDLAPVGYLTLSDRGVIQRLNLSAADLLGRDRSSMRETPFTAYLAEGQAPLFFRHLARVLGTKDGDSCELVLKPPGGDPRWIAMHSVPAPAPDPQSEAVLSTLTDVTGRVLASQALERSQARLRAIVDHVGVGIVLVEADGCIVEVNRAAVQLFGRPAPELHGRSFASLLEPGSLTPLEAGLVALGPEAEGVRVDLRIPRGPGVCEVRDTLSRVEQPGSPGHRVLHLLDDVTEERRARRGERRLQIQVSAAHEDKLRALGQLAGGIAHDFNNMLAVILSSCEAAEPDAGEEPELALCLGDIQEAALRARQLVRQILTFARRREPQTRLVNLAEVVEEALRLIRAAAPPEVDVGFEASAQPAVRADPSQLHHVLLNLATNAYQAMAGSQGSLRLEVNEREATPEEREAKGEGADAYAVIRVSDDGPGMSQEVLDRIFEPYFTTRDERGGTGMGLAMAQSIVDLHGGAISVESTPGRGSVFDVALPAEFVEPQPDDHPPQERPWRGCVALVDDNVLVRAATRRLLQRLGCRVFEFTSARSVLEALERQLEFDALITDHQMPGMTGLELAERMRAALHRQPVILMAGNVNAVDVDRVQLLESMRVLAKPSTGQELCRALHQIAPRKEVSDAE